jgi:hypothetical protein
MEDFDFDFDNEIGTQIEYIKDKDNKNNQNYTDTELDYDKIIDNLVSDQSNNFDYNSKKNSCINTINNYKKKSDIDNVVNNISTDINNNKIFDLNFNPVHDRINDNKKELNKCVTCNHNKQNIPSYNPDITESDIQNDDNKKDDNKKDDNKKDDKNVLLKKLKKIIFHDNRDIMIIILIFILINTHLIIDLINNKISFIKNINNIYPNLIIRAIIFGLILYILKKNKILLL